MMLLIKPYLLKFLCVCIEVTKVEIFTSYLFISYPIIFEEEGKSINLYTNEIVINKQLLEI